MNEAAEVLEMYRCFRVSICHFCRTVLRSRCLNRGTVIRIPIRQIYRGKGGGISVFTTPQSAEVFVASLHENERELLREALRITPYNQAEENCSKCTQFFCLMSKCTSV